MIPAFTGMGFRTEIVENPRNASGKNFGPFLLAERIEDPAALTVLGYGHGDVIRGMDAEWSDGLSPWTLVDRGDRWYGRGVVDNKGQHLINMTALRAVLETKGKLGFNAKYLIEMGEEMGSPGLRELCGQKADALRADVLVASDGPRLSSQRPTIFLGARGGSPSTSGSTRARAAIIPATGAGSSPTRRSSCPMQSRASSAPRARSACRSSCRARSRRASGARSPTSR